MSQFVDCSLNPNLTLALAADLLSYKDADMAWLRPGAIPGISAALVASGSVATNQKNGLLSWGDAMDDTEHQAELWRIEASNRLLQSAHAIAVLTQYDDSVNKEWAESRIGFFHQTADELHPTEEAWPELPPNVIPFTTIMRRK